MGNEQGTTKTFYHYTDDAGAKGIKQTGVIKGSSRVRGDAAFGRGAYFTSFPPTEDKCDIVANNYDNDTRHNYSFVKDVVKTGNYIFTLFLFMRLLGRLSFSAVQCTGLKL